MIDKHYSNYCVVCDICGEKDEEVFDTFDEAVDHISDSSWKVEYDNGMRLDVCIDCQGIRKNV